MKPLHPPSPEAMAGQASKSSLEFGEDVPASFHYAVARKKRLACHGVARKGADGRLRSPFFGKKMAAEIFVFPRHSETHFELKLQNFAVKSNSENRFTFR